MFKVVGVFLLAVQRSDACIRFEANAQTGDDADLCHVDVGSESVVGSSMLQHATAARRSATILTETEADEEQLDEEARPLSLLESEDEVDADAAEETDGEAGGDATEWLRKTNEKRAMHGACPVTWNRVLAKDMRKWIKSLSSLKHDNIYQLKPPHGPCGENLAWASNGANIDMAINGWYSEVNDCANPRDGCQHGRGGKPTGHFTAMVWKGAREMGCAKYKNFAGCRYMERNVKGLSGNTPNMGGMYKHMVGVKGEKATGC